MNVARGWDIRYRFFDGTALGEMMSLNVSASVPKIALAQREDALTLAWIADGIAMTQSLTPLGNPISEPVAVSAGDNVVSDISIALDDRGGLVAFVVDIGGRKELHSRLLDLEGGPFRNERIVSSLHAGVASFLVAYSGGFAAVYRGRSPEGDFSLELAFIHGSTGMVVDRYSIDSTNWADGRPGVAVTVDGTLGIAWAEQQADGTQIRGARIQCEEAWLRCSAEP